MDWLPRWFNWIGKQLHSSNNQAPSSRHLGGVLDRLNVLVIVVFVSCRDNPFLPLPPTEFSRTLCSFRSSFYLRTLLLGNKKPTRANYRQQPLAATLNLDWCCSCCRSETNRLSSTALSQGMSFSDDCKPNLLSPFRLYMRLTIIIIIKDIICGSQYRGWGEGWMEWQEIVQWFRHSPCRPDVDE